MNRVTLVRVDRATLIDGLTDDIEHASQNDVANGHGNRGAGIDDFIAALETLRRSHGHSPNPIIAQVLFDLECLLRAPLAGYIKFDGQGVIDGRQGVEELDVDDGPDNLN